MLILLTVWSVCTPNACALQESAVYSPTTISVTKEKRAQRDCTTEGCGLVPEEVGFELRSGGWEKCMCVVCVCVHCVCK